MKHETHLSAQQNSKEEKIRLPSPHENLLGTEINQPPPQSRPQAPRRRLTFSKDFRFRTRRDFKTPFEGERRVGKLICIDIRKSRLARLGLTVSRKYGNSPERNRFKRLVREAFRLQLPHLPRPLDVHVVPRQKAKGICFQSLQSEFLQLLKG